MIKTLTNLFKQDKEKYILLDMWFFIFIMLL